VSLSPAGKSRFSLGGGGDGSDPTELRSQAKIHPSRFNLVKVIKTGSRLVAESPESVLFQELVQGTGKFPIMKNRPGSENEQEGRSSKGTGNGVGRSQPRASLACTACRQRKIKVGRVHLSSNLLKSLDID